ncbi:hypothetical protein HMN09_00327100 [Mycena chlorophos]|uniref:Uncharacterized protein n=1 Tax=Mycena chlorophos TaxID=658473 RepID=A0A8H6WMW4_MYCCL|nr:hypothetical protein HMN09_00327100 [Mycena chlorophos]
MLSCADVAGHPLLAPIPLEILNNLMRMLGVMKNDILLAQPHHIDHTQAPPLLAPLIIDFLSAATAMPVDAISTFWDVFRDAIWAAPKPTLSNDEKQKFMQYGSEFGFGTLSRRVLHVF